MCDPIATARSLLDSIRKNIIRLQLDYKVAKAEERSQLKQELQLALRQEREASRYV